MARLILFPLAIFILSLTGCTTSWETQTPPVPITYTAPDDQLSRKVGKLRRLLVLPVTVQTNDCPVPPTDEAISKSLFENTLQYLADWKGYEPLTSKGPARKDVQKLAMGLGQWQEKDVKDGFPREQEKIDIKNLASEDHVDGIVVIYGDISCLNTIDIVMYFMIIGMPNWADKLFNENLSAGIYDGQSGRLVWKSYVNVLHPSVGGGRPSSDWPSTLFSTLENAIPAILTK